MKKKCYLFFVLVLFVFEKQFAATITSTGTGSWSSGSSWVGGVSPASTDDVIIANGSTITLDGNYSCNSLSIATGVNNSTLDLAGFSLIITNSITINAPTVNNIVKRILVDNGQLSAGSLIMTNTGSANRDCFIHISSGVVTILGNITMNGAFDRNHIDWTGNGTLFAGGNVTGGGYTPSGSSTVHYNGTAQTCGGAYNYDNVIFSNSGMKTIGGAANVALDFLAQNSAIVTANSTLSISGNLSIINTSSLTLSGALNLSGDLLIQNNGILTPSNNSISLGGDFTVTHSADFVEGTSTVTLNGSVGTQTISNSVTGTETFYRLVINNTSISNPSVICSSTSLIIQNDYDHTNGFVDLMGNGLSATGANSGNQTFSWTGGGIISNVSGATLDINQGANVLSMVINAFQIGDALNGIITNISSDNSTWENSVFYGVTNFTKTGITSQTFGGGNSFFGSCSFVTISSAGRWRMGDNGSGTAGTDTYYNATFEHNGSSNFIVGCNNNTHYYGNTVFKSTSAGGVYIGRQNGTVGSYIHSFHGPVVFNLEFSGNIGVADATTNYNQSAVFESTIQVNSTSTSTGDIYFGNSAASTITITNTGQFIAGSIAGRTSTYFRNITQTGSLTQTYSTAGTGARLYCGFNGTPVLPCSFDGACSFSVDTLSITRSTFNENVIMHSTQSHLVSYSIFNGTTNMFSKNGSTNDACTGGNVFAAGTTTTVTNNSSGYWRWANTVADDFNGNVVFKQTNTGVLDPVYATNSTFSGNISTLGTTTAIAFGLNGGRVVIDGNTTQFFDGAIAYKPTVRRLTMSTSAGGTLTLNTPIDINNDLSMTSGIIITSSTNIINLNNASTTTVGNANSFIDGPMQYVLASGSSTRSTLNFPIGKSSDWRPASLQLAHSVGTSYTYRAEVFNASAEALGWTKPATVDTVSYVHYWDIERYLTSTMVNTPSANLRTTAADRPIITLYFGTNDAVKDGANLTICKNTTGAPTTWIDIGGTGAPAYAAGANLAGSVTSTSSPTVFNSFSRFTLGSKLLGWNPLPIELLSFTAVASGSRVDLKWTTTSEINNDYFTIEKSIDAINFDFVAEVDGAGNSTELLNYSTMDTEPNIGVSYYRLKQVDFNGDHVYYPYVAVDYKSSDEFSFELYPNPGSADNINLLLNSEKDKEVLLVLFDVNGKEVYSKVLLTSTDGENVYAIDPSSKISPGVYLVTATSNQNIYSKRLIIR